MPVVLDGAQGVVVHLAQVADGRCAGDQTMHVLATDGAAIDGAQDEFQFLGNDTFDFEKLVLVLLGELLGSRHGHERVELFPTLQIVLHAGD